MDDDRFWVKSLTLENFRCFERLELRDLDPHFNLLVGANGTGKSSVLLALARLFRDLAALWWPISTDSILSGRDRRNSGPLQLPGSSKVEAKQPWVLSSEFAWHTQTYNVSETFYPEPFSSGTHYEVLADSRKTETITSTAWSQKLHAGPQLIAFYRVRRQFARLISNADAPEFVENPEYAGLQNWDDAGVSSVALHEWLKDQTLLALQSEDRIRRGIGKPGETPARRQLTLVQARWPELWKTRATSRLTAI